MLPPESADTSDELVNTALQAWMILTGSGPPTGSAAHRQREWDSRWTSKAWTTLHESTNNALDRARLLASRAPHAGDWLLAPPVTALGLRLSDDVIWIAVGIRLDSTWNDAMRATFVSLWPESRRQRTPRSGLQKKRWQTTTPQHAERYSVAIVWKSKHPFPEGTVGPHQRRWQTTRRRDTYPVVMRKVPHLGRDRFGHFCDITSGSNINRSRGGRKPGRRRQEIQIRYHHQNTRLCGGCIGVQRFLEF